MSDGIDKKYAAKEVDETNEICDKIYRFKSHM